MEHGPIRIRSEFSRQPKNKHLSEPRSFPALLATLQPSAPPKQAPRRGRCRCRRATAAVLNLGTFRRPPRAGAKSGRKRRGRNRVGQMLGEAVVLGTCSFEAGVWEWGDMSFSRHALKHDPCFGVMSHWIFFST